MNLRYAFQDDENCFFVLDLMLGGDLRCTYLIIAVPNVLNISPQSIWRDWALSRRQLCGSTWPNYPLPLVSCIHTRLSTGTCHRPHFNSFLTLHGNSRRDLKPDNILLDEAGHAHLTDFNIAVHYSDRRPLSGVAGSMAYMAPEILAKRGYSYQIDWWSLGVCAYELIFGRRPFRGRTNSDLTHSIVKDSLRFPEDGASKCSREGMQALRMVSGLHLLLLIDGTAAGVCV